MNILLSEIEERCQGKQIILATHSTYCLAPEFLDRELSVFMQQLRVQGAAGELGRA
jgi:hypothetical protein